MSRFDRIAEWRPPQHVFIAPGPYPISKIRASGRKLSDLDQAGNPKLISQVRCQRPGIDLFAGPDIGSFLHAASELTKIVSFLFLQVLGPFAASGPKLSIGWCGFSYQDIAHCISRTAAAVGKAGKDIDPQPVVL